MNVKAAARCISDHVAVAAVPGNWYLLGVPFLIKTRRMLDGMDTGNTTGTPFEGRHVFVF